MKEKKFLRKLLIMAGMILVIYLVVQGVTLSVLGKDYTFAVGSSGLAVSGYTSKDIEISMDQGDVVTVEEIEDRDGQIFITLKPENAGRVFMEITDQSGTYIDSLDFKVYRSGLIINTMNGNFAHYRISTLYMMLMLSAFTLLMWFAFYQAQKRLRFSYNAIFCCGLGIWFALISLQMIYGYVSHYDMSSFYYILQTSSRSFVIFTLPVVLIFCILLSISNISLIRHEGFRMKNALGAGLSAALIIGIAAVFIIDNLYTGGYELTYRIVMSVISILYAGIAIMECFLAGSVICGILSARHTPAYDKDYIIILGCAIRPDGTLYPLIRGRVDRAISFYRKQFEKTGRKAVFIPSGGQGSDEIISESEAMARYLREQGIEESQIRIENGSRNTRQNMMFSKAVIDREKPDAKAVFSTTNYHVFRSGIISRQVDFEPDGIGSPTKWYFWPNAFIREVIGMITYKWKALLILFIVIAAFLISVQMFL